jgi:hypothetical protein
MQLEGVKVAHVCAHLDTKPKDNYLGTDKIVAKIEKQDKESKTSTDVTIIAGALRATSLLRCVH